ncbi:astacin, partial [Ostertagia ostertagi]
MAYPGLRNYGLMPGFLMLSHRITHLMNALFLLELSSSITRRRVFGLCLGLAVNLIIYSSGKWTVAFPKSVEHPVCRLLSLDNGCMEYATIIHEMMHVVGFYHEHERWDRDNFIDIIWQNIDRGALDQFGKVDLSKTSYYGQPYDYKSILHYDIRTAFRRCYRNKNYHEKTCIRFVPRSGGEPDYLFIGKVDGCFSEVGRTSGVQVLSLDNGCMEYATIIHEMMHVVGFYHEHERWDRDNFIDIIWQNIDRGRCTDQFGKVDLSKTSYYGQPYDYKSILHYDSLAFRAIRTALFRRCYRNKNVGIPFTLGNRSNLADRDGLKKKIERPVHSKFNWARIHLKGWLLGCLPLSILGDIL